MDDLLIPLLIPILILTLGALVLPPGAFIVLGLLLAARQAAQDRAKRRARGTIAVPVAQAPEAAGEETGR